ncbi:50S ribosomal protein L18 [soil metagenome]
MTNTKLQRKARRERRVRSKIHGTSERPRVSVHRSNKYIYAQVIDDDAAKTLASFSSMKMKADAKVTKVDEAKEVGKQLADLMKNIKVQKVIFDRGSFAYKGRLKSLAEGLRENGIEV